MPGHDRRDGLYVPRLLVGMDGGFPNVGADIISQYWPEDDMTYTQKFQVIFEFIREVNRAIEATHGVGSMAGPRGLIIAQGYRVDVAFPAAPTLKYAVVRDPIAADEGAYTTLLTDFHTTLKTDHHFSFFDKVGHDHRLTRIPANYSIPTEIYS